MGGTENIPWLRLLAEGFAIVASILIAFALDAGWAARQERNQEREILAGLADEFQANSEAVKASMQAGQNQVETLERLLRMGPPEILSLDDAATIRLAEVFSHRPFDPVQAELDAVVASGSFDLLRNAQLKRALSGWRRLVAKLEKQEATQLESSNKLLDSLMGYGVTDALVVALGTGQGGELRKAWAAAMTDPVVRDVAAVTLMVRHSYLTGDLGTVQAEAKAVLGLLPGPQ
jgi:hypothetical protein